MARSARKDQHPSQALIRAVLSKDARPRRVKASTAVAVSPQRPIAFTVYGRARPKGSKTGIIRGGRVLMVEGRLGGQADAIKEWAEEIEIAACTAAAGNTITGPVQIAAKFWFACPKSRTPGDWHQNTPDWDKLARLAGDAIVKAGAIVDDRYIATWDGSWKRYCRVGEEPRVEIEIIPLGPPID